MTRPRNELAGTAASSSHDSKAAATDAASPCTAAATAVVRPKHAASLSTWTTALPVSNVLRAVVQVLRLAPNAMTQSASAMTCEPFSVETVPMTPIEPSSARYRPRARSVVASGAPIRRAKASTASRAPEATTPWPARTSGRCADAITPTAASS